MDSYDHDLWHRRGHLGGTWSDARGGWRREDSRKHWPGLLDYDRRVADGRKALGDRGAIRDLPFDVRLQLRPEPEAWERIPWERARYLHPDEHLQLWARDGHDWRRLDHWRDKSIHEQGYALRRRGRHLFREEIDESLRRARRAGAGGLSAVTLARLAEHAPVREVAPGVTVSETPVERTGVPLEELVYRPEQGAFIALTGYELSRLLEACAPWSAHSEALVQARAGGDHEAHDVACARINAALEPEVAGRGANRLAELFLLGARRCLYLPEAETTRLTRRHVPLAPRPVSNETLRRDVLPAFTGPAHYWGVPGSRIERGWSTWYWATDEGRLGTEPDERLFRYVSGAPVFQDFHDRLRLSREGLGGEFSLIRAHVGLEGYYPRQGGYRVVFEAPGIQEPVDLGRLRLVAAVLLEGFAGASVLAEPVTDFEVREGRVRARGASRGGKAGAFAGATAECAVDGSLEWYNPNDGIGFEAFAQVGASGEVAFGAGAAAQFRIGFEAGRFLIQGRARAVLGPGAGGSLLFMVDTGHLWAFFRFLGQKVRELGQQYGALVQERAYRNFNAAFARFGAQRGDPDSYLLQERALDEWWTGWDSVEPSPAQLAANLQAHPDLVYYATPAMRGRWLAILEQGIEEAASEVERERLRQAAVSLTRAIQDQAERNEVMACLTLDGGRINPAEGASRLAALAADCPELGGCLAGLDALPERVAVADPPEGTAQA